ncbi:MAG: MmgE/PrpD family protein [Pseudomonadales bacterium]
MAEDTTLSEGVTGAVARRVTNSRFSTLPEEAVTVTKQCLLDIIGVTLAGLSEPLSQILLEEAAEEGGNPQASILGSGRKASLTQAALVNGSAGHAHDYDDVNNAMGGHPTIPVAPAALALAEYGGASGEELINALATGIDAECLVGRYIGPSHYGAGWHATGTFGTFGAAAASAALMNLDADATARAFGIAGTQAAGLKSMFGTMCKPLHAGHAAATGLSAARLAARGFTARTDVLEAEQGFGATQSSSTSEERFRHALDVASFVPDTCFKYHAACYLTHSSIEAARALKAEHAIEPDDIESVEITVNEGHFGVCNIQEPSTGLEAKFSLRFTAAMALAGLDTASIDIYTDALTEQPELVALRDKTTVAAHAEPRAESRVAITTRDGRTLAREENVGIPLRDLELQWQKLETKFRTLVDPVLGSNTSEQLIAWCRELETHEDLSEFWSLLRN